MRRAKTQKLRSIPDKSLVVGVDIGMNNNSCFFTTTRDSKGKPFKFGNDRTGFDMFWSKVIAIKKDYDCTGVVIGFESTGPYGEPFIHYLLGKPVHLVQVNPMHTKRTKEICDNSPLKSDDKDPKVIADLIKIGNSLSLIVPEGEAAELRRLNNARESHVKSRTALANQLRQLMFGIFPEMRLVMKNMTCKTGMHIIRKYPTPEDIRTMTPEHLGMELKKISRGAFGIKEARTLIEYAMTSVGIKEGRDGLLMNVRQILSLIEQLNGFIGELEIKMEESLKKIPESSNLLSIKGLGVITAAGLLGEIACFRHFDKQSSIIKLAGLNLYELSSGQKKGIHRISKRGRSTLRKILFYAALNVSRKGGILHSYYKRLVEVNKMKKKKALIAVSRKLLRIIFALARDNSRFVENYHKIKVVRKAA